MRAVFRTDASLQIGSGHVMRCITLADNLRENGIEVQFICRDHPGHLCAFIENHDFSVTRLASSTQHFSAGDRPYSKWLGSTQEEDAAQTIAALENERCDWLIVDHYALDIQWEKKLRRFANRIAVIDDLADRVHDCDLLIDQNYRLSGHENRYDALVPVSCEKLLGPKYALLRPEFLQLRASLKPRSGLIKRVMVFFGAVDACNMTIKALNGMAQLKCEEMVVNAVVGMANQNRGVIREICEAHKNFAFHDYESNIAELMSEADLSIGAGGGTMWERCCLGLPTILVSAAANQDPGCEAVSDSGAGIFLGDADATTSSLIANAVNTVCASPSLVRSISRRAMELVDGLGAKRVTRRFLLQPVVLRSAKREDCDAIYVWRNAPEVRRYSGDDREIDITAHHRWFNDSLVNPNRIILIGEVQEQPIGVLRYDRMGHRATASVYLVPGRHGLGFGPELLKAGTQWLLKNWPEIEIIEAHILTRNRYSVKAFRSAGYSDHYFIFQADIRQGSSNENSK